MLLGLVIERKEFETDSEATFASAADGCAWVALQFTTIRTEMSSHLAHRFLLLAHVITSDAD